MRGGFTVVVYSNGLAGCCKQLSERRARASRARDRLADAEEEAN